METGYLDFLLKEMAPIFDAVPDPADRHLVMAATLTRFLNCDSLLDLAKTYHINKDSLYASVDAISPPRWLRRILKRGRMKLLGHLRAWAAGDPAFKSRHSITLCADDFTRIARGEVGGWAGIFYSGAAKCPVKGINVEALCAVIGDGLEVILLDVRIVPPKPEGSGRRPLIHNAWLRRSLRSLHTFLKVKGAALAGIHLAIDAAYVCPETIALTKEMGIHTVSKLAANRKVDGMADGPFTGRVPEFAGLALFVKDKKCRELRGEEGVTYQRNTVDVPSLGATVLMITFVHGREFVVYFTTQLTMKAITLRNIIRYRWQLERLFWIVKQDIGIGDIHHQQEARTESRVYLHFMLAQITREAAGFFKCSPKDIVRAIRRCPDLVLMKLGFPSAFANGSPSGAVPTVPLAA